MIAQVGEAVALMLRLVREGQLDPALIVVQRTLDVVLPGPLRAMAEKLEAASVVAVLGPGELDRVRMYAAILAEEGVIHELRGDHRLAAERARRAFELYTAAAGAGARLLPADRERMAELRSRLGLAPA
jgi:hypothetical protein